MKPLAYHEFNAFVKTISGPTCVSIHDGDYDRAVITPDGQCVELSMYGVPQWTRFWRVDAVIECLDITSATRDELIRLMPNAYGGERPVEYYGNEPDLQRDEDYKLRKIWQQLSEEAKTDLLNAYNGI